MLNEEIEKQILITQTPIRAIRDIKNKYNISPTAMPTTSVNTSVRVAEMLNDNSALICQMAGTKVFMAGTEIEKPKNAATAIMDDMQIYVHDVIDPEAERARFEKRKQEIEKAKEAIEAKLANEDFVNKAKPEVVARARDRLAELLEQLNTVEKHLSEL